jgi:hypothetical protein
MSNTKYDKAFLTGCDSNTEWMMEWFLRNLKKNTNQPIIFADFGVKDIEIFKPHVHAVIDMTKTEESGWFKKPKAMMHCPARKTVWLDSDIEVLENIDSVFDLLEPNKLNMVKDKPWSTRFQTEMFNSGVVGLIDKPYILSMWIKEIKDNPARGDQETLHAMLDPLQNLTYISELPNKYNFLRLQFENDGQKIPKGCIAVHWTGQKGKDRIKERNG